MAITATERTQMIGLTVMMFEAAPGATYLSQIVAMYESNGRTLPALANLLDDTAFYTQLNPGDQTLCAFTTELLGPLHLANDRVATDFVAAHWAAGDSKGQIAFEALAALQAIAPSAAPQYLWAQTTLHEKVQGAEYYSAVAIGGALDLQVLRAIVAPLDADHPFQVDGAHVSIVGSAPGELPTGP